MATIVAVRARALDVPLKKPFGIAGGAQKRAKNVVIEVELADGNIGYGEAAPFPAFNGETQQRAFADCNEAVSIAVGHPIEELPKIVARFDPKWIASARCALESALYDAYARSRGQSLREVFGGKEEELVTDITITINTVEDAEAEARSFDRFRTLKIKVGGACDVDYDVKRVLAVARARPDARLLVDANAGFTVDDAIRFAKELRAHDVVPFYFEQPVGPFWELLAEVRAKSGLAIAIDESVTSVADIERAIHHKAADAVNVKIMKSGVGEALAIARAAEQHGLGRMIGGMVETRLAMSVSACIAAGLGGFAIVDLDTPLFLAEDPWTGGYELDGDRIDLRPIKLGHGLTPRCE